MDVIKIILSLLLITSTANAQHATVLDFGGGRVVGSVPRADGGVSTFTSWTRFSLAPPVPTTLSLEQAINRINASDQRVWLSYLASEELDGRKPNTAGYRKAVEYIEAKCQEWGLKTERQTVPGRDQNLFAYIPGVSSDDVIVVGAHLDHLGNGRLGADDNGSGSVCLMSVAYAFSLMNPPPRTVVFQWYTAEETGLHGSGYYVNNPTFPKNNPSIKKHRAMINMDMVGRYRLNYVVDEHLELMESGASFSQYIATLTKNYPFAKSLTITTGNNSDHARFRAAGVPVVWLFTGTHNDYHTPRDTVKLINFEGMERIARYATELTYLCLTEEHIQDAEPFTIDEMELVNVGGEKFHESH